MRNNQLHALMLIHVHMTILDSITLADFPHDSVDRKDKRKQTFGHFFLRIIHSICRIKLKLRYFSCIYISYQMYITWSCVAFYHLLFNTIYYVIYILPIFYVSLCKVFMVAF